MTSRFFKDESGHGRRRDPRRSRGQSGTTLIEVLIVVALSVPLIVSATIGLMTTLNMGARAEKSQKMEADATAFAEVVKDLPYVDCATVDQYHSAASAIPLTGIRSDLAVVGVDYWDQDVGDYSLDTCSVDGGSQMVTIRATFSGLTTTLEVAKRDPEASQGGDTP